MDITQVFAIMMLSMPLCLLLSNGLPYFRRFVTWAARCTISRLKYVYVVNRHAFLGPWTIALVLYQTLYLALNLFCLSFRVGSWSQAGHRAGSLSLINLGCLMGSPHLDFLARLLGISFKTMRNFHRLASYCTLVLAAIHAVVAVSIGGQHTLTESLGPFPIMVRVAHVYSLS